MRCSNFNPRAPCGARQTSVVWISGGKEISTHAPLAGRDRGGAIAPPLYFFISTHAPLAGRDKQGKKHTCDTGISTHAPLAGRDRGVFLLLHAVIISTHAPLAGRDRACSLRLKQFQNFNPRAPCGARLINAVKVSCRDGFQPTRPLRGATVRHGAGGGVKRYFNPRAPCGARPAGRKTSR